MNDDHWGLMGSSHVIIVLTLVRIIYVDVHFCFVLDCLHFR